MSATATASEFKIAGPRGFAGAAWYLAPAIESLLQSINHQRVLDVGCGNGYWAGEFLKHGSYVMGIDPSESGIQLARAQFPEARFEVDYVTADLPQRLNEEPFDLVISTEVVEHLYSPRTWAEACRACLKPGGHLICSTPYHGYWKNLAICVAGKWDSHHSVHFEGGHIKFFSRRTLADLLTKAGFSEIAFAGAGRFPGFWKSMVLRARNPQ